MKKNYHSLPERSFQLFSQIFSIKPYKKGDIIYRKGEKEGKFFIITEGVARSVIMDEKGNEQTRLFFKYSMAFGSPESNLEEKISLTEINCLTDTRIYEGSFKALLALTFKDHYISILYSRFLEQMFVMMTKKVNSLSTLDATHRYLDLKKEIPNIEDLIQLKKIASYLSITPIQLSRIRKELALT